MLEMLRAHGLHAGPTQRPMVGGVLAGIAGYLPCWLLLRSSGSLSALHGALAPGSLWAQLAFAAAAGAAYALVFQRAANDARGGWLFGTAFGYLLWQAVSVPLLQWLPEEPLLTGTAALGFFASHLVWGLAVGVIFPLVHRPFTRPTHGLPGMVGGAVADAAGLATGRA